MGTSQRGDIWRARFRQTVGRRPGSTHARSRTPLPGNHRSLMGAEAREAHCCSSSYHVDVIPFTRQICLLRSPTQALVGPVAPGGHSQSTLAPPKTFCCFLLLQGQWTTLNTREEETRCKGYISNQVRHCYGKCGSEHQGMAIAAAASTWAAGKSSGPHDRKRRRKP